MLLITLVIGLSAHAYIAGLAAIRYQDPINEPFLTWTYWRYTVMAFVIVLTLVFMWIFAFDVSVLQIPVRGYLFWLIFLAVGFAAVFVVWEIIIWTKCNEVASPGPPPVFKYPHCVNRDYPANNSPDAAFLLTLFGAGGAGVGMLICLYMINQITCAALASRTVLGQGLTTQQVGGTSYINTADFNAASINTSIDAHYGNIGLALMSDDHPKAY
jgi:hypothetical protein